MGNRVCKKILYYIDVICISPLAVFSGEEGTTDNSILYDYDGIPFVSGTTLAGAFRNYYNLEKNKDSLFGFSDSDNGVGRMSSVYISDMRFESCNVNVLIRNGVELNDNKAVVTKGKYDFEAIEPGNKGKFIIELVIRESDEQREDIWEKQIIQILSALDTNQIRIGAHKSRGYGKLRIDAIRKNVYTRHNILEYKNAYDYDKYILLPDIKEELLQDILTKYVKIKIPLKMNGGLSIREYSAKKNLPDFVQLTVHENSTDIPVIPGTSIAGAIRHRVVEILTELGISCIDYIINSIFGYVDGTEAHISNVIFDECRIIGAKKLILSRNAISRFESATKDGALYREMAYYDGNCIMTIYVNKEIYVKSSSEVNINISDYVIGFILIALKDLQNGYLSIGGQTSIGRGIFEEDGSIVITEGICSEEEYISNCIKLLEEI